MTHKWELPPTLKWNKDKLVLIDQTRLPEELVFLECETPEEVAECIKSMKVRGAPAIGVAAAFGIYLAVKDFQGDEEELFSLLNKTAELLKNTRPTAYNLFWAVDRMLNKAREGKGVEEIKEKLLREAERMWEEDIEVNRAIGENGAELLKEEASVLTICNAGSLATVWYGTALGVVRRAVEKGKKIKVYACETRPRLQGLLTVYELLKDGIPVTLITDFMAGYLMSKGKIDAVITGADRIARNGDVANKIGTYTLAVLAKNHNIPFFVAAPLSTIDIQISSGEEIPIEERGKEEVLFVKGRKLLPFEVDVINPAFDVTPARYIGAIITERGVCYPPYEESIPALFEGGHR
ncbi:MAG: S-methyl-5-thioribose-1-phosphate isomerase [bacterium]